MTDQQHPLTPPPELVKQWWKEAQQADYSDGLPCWLNYVATQAARWGADQELEACISWLLLNGWGQAINGLRAARRPKPPSLKEQALAIVCRGNQALTTEEQVTIRRALEQLDD